jgi:hypothetical protein
MRYFDLPQYLRRIKWAYQRVRYGYDETYYWNLDSKLISIILPSLRALRNNHCGHPGDLTDKKWCGILDQMIKGWESAKRVIGDVYLDEIQPGWAEDMRKLSTEQWLNNNVITKETWSKVHEAEKKDIKTFEQSMKLFTKYYFGLWD